MTREVLHVLRLFTALIGCSKKPNKRGGVNLHLRPSRPSNDTHVTVTEQVHVRATFATVSDRNAVLQRKKFGATNGLYKYHFACRVLNFTPLPFSLNWK